MKNKQIDLLPMDEPLRLIAIHKQTFEEFEKTITYKEWKSFKKNKDYYYKAVQIR